MSMSSAWSATSFFSRWFSISRFFRRLASSAFIPPYCARQRFHVASLTSRWRSTSTSSRPSLRSRSPSLIFRTACSGVCLCRFMIASILPSHHGKHDHARRLDHFTGTLSNGPPQQRIPFSPNATASFFVQKGVRRLDHRGACGRPGRGLCLAVCVGRDGLGASRGCLVGRVVRRSPSRRRFCCAVTAFGELCRCLSRIVRIW